jgi:uncharacterized glyoxalase superfamily protein PhnB
MTGFDELRQISAIGTPTPDPRFVARLRSQVEASLAPDIELPVRQETTMSITDQSGNAANTSAVPTQVITPYIAVDDAAGALQWYADALGAVETVRYTSDDGRIGHAEIEVQGARIFLSDAYPEIGVVAANSHEGSSCALHLEVADIDTIHARAVAGGAVAVREPADQPHGARSSTIVDPYGHRWMLSQTIATPTTAEINDAIEGFTVQDGVAREDRALVGPDEVSANRPIQLGYFTLYASDIQRAARFYSRVFGWNVDPDSGHVDNCDLPFGFQSLYTDPVRLWMQVRDADPVIARVIEMGGTIVEDRMYESGRGVECRDDQGNRFDLHHPAPGYE